MREYSWYFAAAIVQLVAESGGTATGWKCWLSEKGVVFDFSMEARAVEYVDLLEKFNLPTDDAKEVVKLIRERMGIKEEEDDAILSAHSEMKCCDLLFSLAKGGKARCQFPNCDNKKFDILFGSAFAGSRAFIACAVGHRMTTSANDVQTSVVGAPSYADILIDTEMKLLGFVASALKEEVGKGGSMHAFALLECLPDERKSRDKGREHERGHGGESEAATSGVGLAEGAARAQGEEGGER